jgi:YidC/Oxa1 family membrane protein insertase
MQGCSVIKEAGLNGPICQQHTRRGISISRVNPLFSPRDLAAAAAAAAAMAFSARRSLTLSHHLTRRLHPSLSHLVPSHHDRSGDPSCSSHPTHQPSRFPSGDLRRRSRSLPLPFGVHLTARRTFSSGPEVDTVLSDAASSVLPAPPFPGEVAAAAADSFLPFAAAQHLIDAVHSFTGLNW